MQIKEKQAIYTILCLFLSQIMASQLVLASLSTQPHDASESLDASKSSPVVRLLSSDEEAIILEFSAEDFQLQEQWIDNRRFHLLSLESAGYISQVGYPQLPVKGVLVAAPPEAEVHLTILESSDVLFSNYHIPPVPQLIIDPMEDELKESEYEYKEDPVIYSSNRFYPDKLAEIKFSGMLRDQRMVCIQFYPLRYNPLTKQLRFHQNIKVQISFAYYDKGMSKSMRERTRQAPEKVFDPFEPLYINTILNYASAKKWRAKLGLKSQPMREERQFFRQMAPALASSDSYKIYIREPGIYLLDYLDLKNAGVDLFSVDPRKIMLKNRGKEMRIYVHGEEDGRFDAGDYIEFYGAVYEEDYSPYNVYWLEVGKEDGPVLRDGFAHLRMEKKDGSQNGTPPVSESFLYTVHEEKNELHWATFPNSEIADKFFWERIFAKTKVDFDVNITHPVETQEDCTVRVMFQGNTQLAHHTRIYLNGQLLEDATWHGQTQHLTKIQTPQTLLKEGKNTITIELPGDIAEVDIIYLNWFAVDYHRRYITDDDSLKFSWQDNPLSPFDKGDTYRFQLEGFTQEDVLVYDITDVANPIQIINPKIERVGEKYRVSFQDEGNGAKTYLAMTPVQKKKPVKIVKDISSNLRSMDNPLPPFGKGEGSDYIIITHEDFYESILPLAKLREQEGIRVKIVPVSDIYDEFNYGLPSDKAIRDFLQYAYHYWTEPAPFCVLLVGDASYDHKDYYGLGDNNYVPTHLFNTPSLGDSASDTWFVALNGDDLLPDMIVGRLPVRTRAQAEAIVEKIINYEQYPTQGDWQRRILLVADDGKIFEESCEQLAKKIPADYEVTKVYLNAIPPTSASRIIIDAINSGCVLVDYVGHGGFSVWAQEKIFQTEDIQLLLNPNTLPFVVNMTCLAGYFHHPQRDDILGENLIRAEGKGAIATLTPAGASGPWGQKVLNELLFENFFTHRRQRLGTAIMEAKISLIAYGGGMDIGIYNLLGDAALKLALPKISIAWDINGDGTVDILDLVIIGSHFGEKITPFAHPNPDVNGDGVVDISDIVIVGAHFGEEYLPAAPAAQAGGEAMAAPHNIGGEVATVWLESSRAWFSYDFVSVDVKVKEVEGLLGFQWNLNFNPSQLEVLRVTEGNFLKGDGETSYWHDPLIDSFSGRIKHCAATRLTEQGISGEGVLATILFRLKTNDFDYFTNLYLTDVKLANTAGELLVFIDESLFASSPR